MEDTLPEIEIVNFWYMFIFCGHRLDILLVMIKICTNRTNHHSSLSIAAGKQKNSLYANCGLVITPAKY